MEGGGEEPGGSRGWEERKKECGEVFMNLFS